jgi:hypothetical protein
MGIPAEAKTIERLAKLGTGRVVHWLPSANRAGVKAALERWEAPIADYTGEA